MSEKKLTKAQERAQKKLQLKKFEQKIITDVLEYSKMQPDNTYCLDEFLNQNNYTYEELVEYVPSYEIYVDRINKKQKHNLLMRLTSDSITQAQVSAIKVILDQLEKMENKEEKVNTGITIELVSNKNRSEDD